MLQGFKQYFELQELSRLEASHYLIVLPTSLETASDYLNGTDGLRHLDKDMLVTADRLGHMTHTTNEALVVVLIPKRWFTRSQLEEKGVTGAIGELLPLGQGWKLPANYVWGYFSKQDGFHRNSSYHGHDGLYNLWKKQTARPKNPESLNRSTPRLVAPFSPQTGRIAHGYSSAFEEN